MGIILMQSGFSISEQEQVSKTEDAYTTFKNHYVNCKCGEWGFINPETLKVTVNKQERVVCEFCGIEQPEITVRKGKYAFKSIPKLRYLGQCDKLRQSQAWERLWNKLMNHKRPCSEEHFLSIVDVSAVLDDDGETWEQYRDCHGDDVKYFSCDGYYFFQTCGFEFFWG